jgi:hypothetical protein
MNEEKNIDTLSNRTTISRHGYYTLQHPVPRANQGGALVEDNAVREVRLRFIHKE